MQKKNLEDKTGYHFRLQIRGRLIEQVFSKLDSIGCASPKSQLLP